MTPPAGTCSSDGVCVFGFNASCDSGAWTCSYTSVHYESGAESGSRLCDSLDNNCDGATDESCSAQGDACSAGEQCPSGQCVDGVCCDTACNEACKACTGSSTGQTNGTCAFISAGIDPDNECIADPWINEIHYDNAGTDENEGFEIAGPAGLSLDGWSLLSYNGATGQVYASNSLSGSLTDAGDGIGFAWFDASTLQNGPDGLALVNPSAVVVSFLSYGGTFTATDGDANGQTSVALGVEESASTASTESLQLNGSGYKASDFTWSAAATSTHNATNTTQTITTPSAMVCDGAGQCVDACSDTVQNQDETDIDCGGICGNTCAVGKGCNANSDCVTGDCELSTNLCQ